MAEIENSESMENQLLLVATVLGAKEPKGALADKMREFDRMLNEDYAKFASMETTFTNDAGALKELLEIQSELKRVSQFPMLFTKNIVAVAGGFSSGKSSLLNTFFADSQMRLSVDMNPTTAIPTFVVPGTSTKVTAYTPDGRQGDIPPRIFSKIDHELIERLKFNLTSIMPYVTVSAPFNGDTSSLSNICFVDTPGYDAAGKGSSGDRFITSDSLMNASSIIWCVSVESGDIRQDDLNFLNDALDSGDKKIYIVCTKSDRRTPSDVQNVMRRISETLDDEGIDIEGISAITVQGGRLTETEFEDFGTTLLGFLEKQNKVSVNTVARCKELTDRVSKVFSMYESSIQKDIEKCERKKQIVAERKREFNKRVSEIERRYRDVEIDFDIDFSGIFEDRTETDKTNLDTVARIRDSMCSIIRAVFPKLECPKCGKRIDNDSPFCVHCGASVFGDTARKCPKCGIPIDDDTAFCPSCGTKIN